MANLYGVANAPGYPLFTQTIGGVNISCPTGSYVPVFTTLPIIAPSQGYFFVMAWFNVGVQIGGSYPNGIFWQIQIGAGAPTNGVSSAGPYPVSSTIQLAGVTATAVSQVAWQGAGSTVTLSCQPVPNAVTVNFGGSFLVTSLFRAPDQ